MKLDIPKKLNQIIDKFEKIDQGSLKELKLKSDFIEPFFHELGWDSISKKNEYIIEPEIKRLNKKRIKQKYMNKIKSGYNNNIILPCWLKDFIWFWLIKFCLCTNFDYFCFYHNCT